MATFIYVSGENELIRRNRAELELNRRRKVIRDALAQIQQQKPKPKPPINARRRRALLEEEPTAPLLRVIGMAHFWYWLDGYQNRNDWRVYSGDASAYVEGSEYSPPVDGSSNTITYDATWLALPVEADKCIAVMMARRYDIFTLPGGGTSTPEPLCINRAFIVSTRRVRQIEVPAPLAAIINLVLNPPGYDASFDDLGYEYNGVPINPFPPRQIYGNVGWADIYGSSSYQASPTVYELLNTLLEFIDPAQVKPFPIGYKWTITPDFRYGAFKPGPADPDQSRYYAEWLGEPGVVEWVDGEPGFLADPASKLKPRPDMTLRLPPGFEEPLPPPPVSAVNYGTVPQSHGIWTCWDWDSANYCRRMLYGLGFTAADLSP